MKKGLIYIHGKGGTAEEAEHYKPLFPEHEVVGLDYRSQTPWDAKEEFQRFFDGFSATHSHIIIVANSIGAFFAMCAFSDKRIEKAYFVSPIVNMEKLILGMMGRAGVSERELLKKGTIQTSFGEILSWNYLLWVRNHPVSWDVSTRILYGGRDNLQSFDTIQAFSDETGAEVTVMKDGEHWFHTAEQMAFLDDWIRS